MIPISWPSRCPPLRFALIGNLHIAIYIWEDIFDGWANDTTSIIESLFRNSSSMSKSRCLQSHSLSLSICVSCFCHLQGEGIVFQCRVPYKGTEPMTCAIYRSAIKTAVGAVSPDVTEVIFNYCDLKINKRQVFGVISNMGPETAMRRRDWSSG